MANRWRHLAAATLTSVAQAKTFTITGTGGGTAVWTLTLTDDKGNTHTVSYTEDGTPTTAEVATGLFDAWNASANPFLSRITATNPSADVLVLTADTQGRPFSVALADDGSGTHTETDTTANVGFNDWEGTYNWTDDALPDQYDDVVFEKGKADVLYGLDQSAVQIADFFTERDCQSNFGRQEFGEYFFLKLKPTAFDYRGNGRVCLFDLGSEAIGAYVEAYGTPGQQGQPTVFLKGSALTTIEIARGNVGIAAVQGDTATVATVLIGQQAQQGAFQSNIHAILGAGLTLTTLTQSAGMCTMRCGATTATCSLGAILVTEGSGAITTLNAYGTVYPNSSGTITTLNVHGICDMTRDRTARTVTNCNLYPGALLIYPPQVTFTNNFVGVTPADTDPRPIQLRPVA